MWEKEKMQVTRIFPFQLASFSKLLRPGIDDSERSLKSKRVENTYTEREELTDGKTLQYDLDLQNAWVDATYH